MATRKKTPAIRGKRTGSDICLELMALTPSVRTALELQAYAELIADVACLGAAGIEGFMSPVPAPLLRRYLLLDADYRTVIDDALRLFTATATPGWIVSMAESNIRARLSKLPRTRHVAALRAALERWYEGRGLEDLEAAASRLVTP